LDADFVDVNGWGAAMNPTYIETLDRPEAGVDDTLAVLSDDTAGGPRVTLAEVALEAGVSVPTVSKVLNGKPDVSAATRKRVEELLSDAGYRPRRRQASAGRSRIIELVLRGLDSPWSTLIIEGVDEVAHQMGRGVVVTAVHGKHRPPRAWLDAVIERRSDGAVLVVSDLGPAQHRSLEGLGIPSVYLDPLGQPPTDAPSVGATNWAGGLAAAEHLLGLGHERIAVISGPPHLACSRARVDGYRAAMHARGISVPQHYVRFAEFHQSAGLHQASMLLELRQRPTAIFCASDMVALGAYEAAHRQGLRVPDDVSIVGFDDIPLAAWVQPNLTTVRQPLLEMASLATRMLFRLIDGEALDATQVEVATRLVVRNSTAPLG
jgi:LacI family transcriptional regulator